MSNSSPSPADNDPLNQEIRDALERKRIRRQEQSPSPEVNAVPPVPQTEFNKYGDITGQMPALDAATARTLIANANAPATLLPDSSTVVPVTPQPTSPVPPLPKPTDMSVPKPIVVGAVILIVILIVVASVLIGMFIQDQYVGARAKAMPVAEASVAATGASTPAIKPTTVAVAVATGPTAVATAPAATTVPAPTATLAATATLKPIDAALPSYNAGIAQANKNNNAGIAQANTKDWEAAVAAFQTTYEINNNYLDIKERLAGSLYNLGYFELRDAVGKTLTIPEIEAISARFERSDKLTPPREPAQQWVNILATYEKGRKANDLKDWETALTLLEDRDKLPFTWADIKVLDTPQQLYIAYLGSAKSRSDAGDIKGARAFYVKAQALQAQDVDVSVSLTQVSILPTATSAPTVTPSATRVSGRVFKANPTQSFPNTGNANQFNSCVDGRVTSRNGGGIDGAVVDVNNGPKNHFQRTTSGGGKYSICGLGASNWTAVLIYIPGKPALDKQHPSAVVYVNGNQDQHGVVNFLER